MDAGGVARCGCGCGLAVDLEGPGVRYDHWIEFWLRPDLDDDGPNVRAVRAECDHPKTYGPNGSVSRIAKTKRQAKMRLDAPREAAGKLQGGRKLPGKGQGPKMKGRGFSGKSRPLQSRNDLRRR